MNGRILYLGSSQIDLDLVEHVRPTVNDWVEVQLRGRHLATYAGHEAEVLRKHFNLPPLPSIETTPVVVAAKTERKPKYITPAKAADELGMHPETMRKALREGKVPGAIRTPGGHWRIPLAYIATQRGETISAGVATT